MMKIKNIRKLIAYVFMLMIPAFYSCSNKDLSASKKDSIQRDFDEIREQGKLYVATDFNSINYFIYRGNPMGFQYELLQELSDDLGIEIEVVVNDDLNTNFQRLANGEVDMIASNLTVTPERLEKVDFSTAITHSRQVIVQRKALNNHSFFHRNMLVKSPFELEGKTVYVQKNSSHAERLHELAGDQGIRINIIEVPIETEQLLRMVDKGEIDYTVSDEDVAMVNSRMLSNINIETAISFPQKQAWALRKSSPQLKTEIDEWMSSFKKTRKFAVLYHKYFRSIRSSEIIQSKFYYPETGRISAYDAVFKKESESIGWDWRLLASMAYQESRFNKNAVSWAGAFGVMQLMPRTAQRFGVNQSSSATAQIRAGVNFIKWLDIQLDDYIEDKDERVKFILASYNIGYGHVRDAMKLAEKYGKNPYIWEDNVEYFLLKKSDPAFFSDPVVKYGYARGTETYNYVRDILYRYDHYRNIQDHNITIAQLVQ